MSLEKWLLGSGQKPGYKRRADDELPSSPAKRKFTKEMNQESFTWYLKDAAGKWHCSVCRQAKTDSAYARGHDTPAKTTNHTRHATSQSHLDAVTKVKLAEAQPMKKIIEKKIQTDNESALGYLWAAYHLAKRELPKEEFPHMLDLLEMSGKDLKRDSNCSYCTNYGISEFQSAIADVILEEKLQEIQNSGVYSIVIDESTDMSNQKRLILYAYYLTTSEVKLCLLNNVQITEESATADVIVGKVKLELNEKGLVLKNLVGISTDGASVMTGRRNGVVKQLRDECPALVGVHCAAHRCALAASQATKDIAEMEWFQRTISSVFRFFNNSALHGNKLREIQQLLNEPTLKYADIHSVRWLSMENAVCVLYRTYPALCATLSSMAENGDVVAKSLYSDVTQYKFIALTHLLMDVLPFLGNLSKAFQSNSLDYSKISPLVSSVCESLQDLVECEGVFVEKLIQFVDKGENESVVYKRPLNESVAKTVKANKKCNLNFEGFSDSETEEEEPVLSHPVTLKYYQQQKELLPKITAKYVAAVVTNLESRFEQKDLITCMDVLVPDNIVEAPDFCKYGNDEIKILAEHFSQQVTVDTDTCISEYKHYKRIVKGNFEKLSLKEIFCALNKKYSEEFPNVITIIKCCLVIPVSSAQCERGFSTQNRIKTRLRTRLNNKNLVNLRRISEDGPELKNFSFEKALIKWKNTIVRKLYSK